MSDRDRLAAIINDHLNSFCFTDPGALADDLLAAGVTMPEELDQRVSGSESQVEDWHGKAARAEGLP